MVCINTLWRSRAAAPLKALNTGSQRRRSVDQPLFQHAGWSRLCERFNPYLAITPKYLREYG